MGITPGSQMFYSVLAIIVFVNCLLVEKYKNKLFVWALIVILTVVAGLRGYSVGSDTYGYVSVFTNSFAGMTFAKDPMFSTVCSVLMHIWQNPSFLLSVFAFIIYSLIALRLWELRDFISFTYAFMTFFCFNFFETMNGLRQFIAVAIIFWGTRYLSKGKYVQFLVSVAVAYIFHITALLGILAFAGELFNWKLLNIKQKRFIMLMVVIGLASSSYAAQYMAMRTESYLHYFDTVVVDIGFRLVALVAIFVLSLLCFDKQKYVSSFRNETEGRYFLAVTQLYYMLALLLGSIGYFFPFMERLGWTFVLFEGVYFGVLVKEQSQTKRWLLKLPILFLLFYVLINYIFFKNGSSHHPYVFIWDQ